jgi:hypothetical protein
MERMNLPPSMKELTYLCQGDHEVSTPQPHEQDQKNRRCHHHSPMLGLPNQELQKGPHELVPDRCTS